MAQGVVRWFNPAKGYGFIAPDFGPKDVFVHASALDGALMAMLKTGQRVEFELTQLRDGRLAAQAVRCSEIGDVDLLYRG